MTINKMQVKDYRNLYEGLTQEDDIFREAIKKLSEKPITDTLFDDLHQAKNRLNYAMLGIHPIYKREVEISGLVNYVEQTLSLYNQKNDIVYSFAQLDSAYVQFLEHQQRIYNVKEVLPLSSVALKTSNELLKDEMNVPPLPEFDMHLPLELATTSRKVLEKAFVHGMVVMNHINTMVEKYGLNGVFAANKTDLLLYVNSNAFDQSFERSVNILQEHDLGVVQDEQ